MLNVEVEDIKHITMYVDKCSECLFGLIPS